MTYQNWSNKKSCVELYKKEISHERILTNNKRVFGVNLTSSKMFFFTINTIFYRSLAIVQGIFFEMVYNSQIHWKYSKFA